MEKNFHECCPVTIGPPSDINIYKLCGEVVRDRIKKDREMTTEPFDNIEISSCDLLNFRLNNMFLFFVLLLLLVIVFRKEIRKNKWIKKWFK